MSEHKAHVKKAKHISAIWLIPFIALSIGLWMVYQQWQNQGPLITINMHSAAGLEANKTKIKTHNVDIGIVKSISLNDSNNGVIVTARINKEAAHLLVEDSEIWVVSPRISNAGVSGLNTLLSGFYIELAPGPQQQQKKTEFIALESPPVTPAGTPGLHITLTSSDKVNYSIGDTISYRGLIVGKFEDIFFDLSNKTVSYNVFIEAPYHQLLTNKTRFWDATGLDVDLSANGIKVKTESLQSLVTSGVAFDDPSDGIQGNKINSNTLFEIYADKETAYTPNYNHSATYTLLVSDSVRGLNTGAPVEFRGINIGKVISINMIEKTDQSLLHQEYRIPVKIAIEPGKVGMTDSQESVAEMLNNLKDLLNQGLRAKLKTGNILTGQLFVELQLYPEEPPQTLSYFDNTPVIPIIANDLSTLADNTNKLLSKLNKLPLQELAQNLNKTITSLNSAIAHLANVIDDVEQQQIVSQLSSTITAAQTLVESYSEGSQSYEEILSTLNKVDALLVAAEGLASSYSEGSESYESINQTLTRLNSVMTELQPLLLNLNKQPNSLIFSGPQPADIEPKARK